eukprot:2604054-Amphidinium_carterae.1
MALHWHTSSLPLSQTHQVERDSANISQVAMLRDVCQVVHSCTIEQVAILPHACGLTLSERFTWDSNVSDCYQCYDSYD